MRHHARVKGVADGNAHGAITAPVEKLNRLRHGVGCPADDALAVAVDVGGDHIAVDLGERFFHRFERRKDRSHPALIAVAGARHLVAAQRGDFQRSRKGEDAGGNERAVFAQRMAHRHVGAETVGAQQLVDGCVHGKHSRLRDGRLHEAPFAGAQGVRVVAIDEEMAGERLAENGRHRPVSLGKDRAGNGIGLNEIAAHVDVLAALSGEEEGDLAPRRAAAAEDAAPLQGAPGPRAVLRESPARLP